MVDSSKIPIAHSDTQQSELDAHANFLHSDLRGKDEWEDTVPEFFLGLPNEIALNILKFLAPTEVTKAAQVSKFWHQLATDDQIWKSIFEQEVLSRYLDVWQSFLDNSSSNMKEPIKLASRSTAQLMASISHHVLVSYPKSYYQITQRVWQFFERLKKLPKNVEILINCWHLARQTEVFIEKFVIEAMLTELSYGDLIFYAASHASPIELAETILTCEYLAERMQMSTLHKFANTLNLSYEAILTNELLMKHLKPSVLIELASTIYYESILELAQQTVCFMDRLSAQELIQLMESVGVHSSVAMAILTRSTIMQRDIEKDGLRDEDIIYLVGELDSNSFCQLIDHPVFFKRVQKNSQMLVQLAGSFFAKYIFSNIKIIKLLSVDQILEIAMTTYQDEAIANLVRSVKTLQGTSNEKVFTPTQIQELGSLFPITPNIDSLLAELPVVQEAVTSIESGMQNINSSKYHEESFGADSDREDEKSIEDEQEIAWENSENAQYFSQVQQIQQDDAKENGDVDNSAQFLFSSNSASSLDPYLDHSEKQQLKQVGKVHDAFQDATVPHDTLANVLESDAQRDAKLYPAIESKGGRQGQLSSQAQMLQSLRQVAVTSGSTPSSQTKSGSPQPPMRPRNDDARFKLNKKWIGLTLALILLGVFFCFTGYGAFFVGFSIALKIVSVMAIKSVGFSPYIVKIASMALGSTLLLASGALLTIKGGLFRSCCLPASKNDNDTDVEYERSVYNSSPRCMPNFEPNSQLATLPRYSVIPPGPGSSFTPSAPSLT